MNIKLVVIVIVFAFLATCAYLVSTLSVGKESAPAQINQPMGPEAQPTGLEAQPTGLKAQPTESVNRPLEGEEDPTSPAVTSVRRQVPRSFSPGRPEESAENRRRDPNVFETLTGTGRAARSETPPPTLVLNHFTANDDSSSRQRPQRTAQMQEALEARQAQAARVIEEEVSANSFAARNPRRVDNEPWAPRGRLIECELITTVDSMDAERTPIIGLVTRDVYHNGDLIVPANTEVHGYVAPRRTRDRIITESEWVLVYPHGSGRNGAELFVRGVALHQGDRSGEKLTWAIHDMSYGLKGVTLRRGATWQQVQVFAAAAMETAANTLVETDSVATGLGTVRTAVPSARNAGLAGAASVLNSYARQVQEELDRNGFYTRVHAGTPFYLYTEEPIFPDRASIAQSLRVDGVRAGQVADAASSPESRNEQLQRRLQEQVAEQMQALSEMRESRRR